MRDERFTYVAEGLPGLLGAADIDDVADVETLFMIVFDQPIEVRVVGNDEGEEALEVTAWTDEAALSTIFSFPMSMVSLAHDVCATLAESNLVLGQSADLPAMTEEGWIRSLQGALGQLRILNMLESDG